MRPLLSLLALPALALAAGLAAPVRAELPQVDRSVSPCQDFFRYACGPWVTANPIPPDQPRWGTFNMLVERNRLVLRGILDKAAAAPAPDTRRIGDFYAACMDEAGAERLGLAPLAPLLARIDGLDGLAALPALLADLHAAGVPAFFSFSSTQDYRDASRMIAVLDQSGLALPDRDYYLKEDARSAELRGAYLAHVARLFALAGSTAEAAAADARTVLAVETDLARGAMDRVERRDPHKTYNMRSRAALQQSVPVFDVAAYLAATAAPAFAA